MRVLGLDPGLNTTGYACLEAGGPAPTLAEAGIIRLTRTQTIAERLVELDSDLRHLFDRLRPDIAGVEGLFAHYKHPATAIAMAHARGVILLRAQLAGARLVELKPGEVKKSLTGNGQARKGQVQRAVAARLGLDNPPEPPDVADAIAIALCAAQRAPATPRGGNRAHRRR